MNLKPFTFPCILGPRVNALKRKGECCAEGSLLRILPRFYLVEVLGRPISNHEGGEGLRDMDAYS